MNALEWNPVFGPVVSALILLGSGVCLYFLFRRLVQRHGRRNSWMLLAPKMILVTLLILALLDPDFKLANSNSTPAKIIIFQDISGSMDLRDDGSSTRAERAARIVQQIEAAAPPAIHFEVLPFDSALHDAGYTPKPDADRGTDLPAVLQALVTQSKFSDADGAIILTDGGDETVQIDHLPTLPLGIVGIGASPDTWNDIGIGGVTAPTSAEDNSQFDLEADLYARPETHDGLTNLKVSLDEQRDGKWVETQTQIVDLSSRNAAVTFHVQVKGSGAMRYRVRLPELPGELTYANNTRVVRVDVRPRALHVLYFTQELGVDYKYLRQELGTDPGVAFTAMVRVLQDQFTVYGDRTGFQDLAQGFPARDDILKRYDCIILGSFAASEFTDAQQQAIIRYVENGGALIWLGGESSFGRGGYADSKLAPLFPWMIRSDETGLTTGSFPVTLSNSGGAVEFTSGWRDDIGAAGGLTLDSLNRPGGLRPGAVGLLDAALTDHTEPVVALQTYGKGQVLGIATNTLWKWASSGQLTRSFYGRFWRQTVRGLTKKLEGGTLLGIRWDKDHYSPGEEAGVEVQLRETGGSAGNIRLVGTISGPGGDRDVSLAPVTGQAGLYSAKIPLPQRGDYTFHLSAYSGTNLAENYERVLPVEPLVEEGANPELKEAYLRQIASQARGIYAYEKDLSPITNLLRSQIVAQQSSLAMPLVNFWNIFPILALLILVTEWLLRRRLNLI